MAQYITCPDCGAHLDHGEKCDCGLEKSYSELNKIGKAKVRDYAEMLSCIPNYTNPKVIGIIRKGVNAT